MPDPEDDLDDTVVIRRPPTQSTGSVDEDTVVVRRIPPLPHTGSGQSLPLRRGAAVAGDVSGHDVEAADRDSVTALESATARALAAGHALPAVYGPRSVPSRIDIGEPQSHRIVEPAAARADRSALPSFERRERRSRTRILAAYSGVVCVAVAGLASIALFLWLR